MTVPISSEPVGLGFFLPTPTSCSVLCSRLSLGGGGVGGCDGPGAPTGNKKTSAIDPNRDDGGDDIEACLSRL